jgi:hypothetical protein
VIAIPSWSVFPSALLSPGSGDVVPAPTILPVWGVTVTVPAVVAAVDPDEDDDLGDEEDLAVSQPPVDEESSFDDFDDEFDDDFEEDADDPDWDHPDDGDAEPPPGKNTGKKK